EGPARAIFFRLPDRRPAGPARRIGLSRGSRGASLRCQGGERESAVKPAGARPRGPRPGPLVPRARLRAGAQCQLVRSLAPVYPGEHTVPKSPGGWRERRSGLERLLDTLLAAGACLLLTACSADPARLDGPTQAIVARDGLVYVADGYFNARVAVFTPD